MPKHSETSAELELSLFRRSAGSYGVELRFTQPDSDADVRVVKGSPARTEINVTQLHQLQLDDESYGRRLSQLLFAEPEVREAFLRVRSAAASLQRPLRWRLFIGPDAPELHTMRWETMRDPENGGPLLTGEQIYFSRYLSSTDWRPVTLSPKADLKALVVVASPTNLEAYQPNGKPLATIDAAAELAEARRSMAPIPVQTLPEESRATPSAIAGALREGFDIFYLVCHGTLARGEPWLWLEDDEGKVARVRGLDFAEALQQLAHPPHLVVLASCVSAGSGQTGDEGTLAALGPLLAESSIPAVLAMQGNVSLRTVQRFMPVFFEGLQDHGQIDRAVAVARGAVRDEPDWWAPVLFMRLKSGRIWYRTGFADSQSDLEKWPALLRHIERRRCTPILGPVLSEPVFGSRRELARRWAETYQFPMAPYDWEDLPQVAQYLSVHQDQTFPRDELEEYVRRELLASFPRQLPPAMEEAPLDELVTAVGTALVQAPQMASYRLLAELPLPLYVSADPGGLLVDALNAVGKQPRVEICRWNRYLELLPSLFDSDPHYRPSIAEPLVYQLFGDVSVMDSLVLTEDDYFDFLIGVTSNRDLVPGVVRRGLADTALLFLGFQVDQWDFRVLFRSIINREGQQRRGRYAHIAVQIDPEEGRNLEPEGARRYLESYFLDADISIFWGSAESFTAELEQRWKVRES